MTKLTIDHFGGEDAVHKLVNRFYDLVERRPEAHQIHRLHFRGHGIDHTRTQQVDFMIGFLGGRAYYREKHGHMDLREIHAHIPIREEDARIWLETWDIALVECGLSGEAVEKVKTVLTRAALRLVNDLADWRTGETV